MSNVRALDARTLDDRRLAEAITEAYRDLFNLQFQRGTRQLQDPTAVRHTRRQIARLRTIQRERYRAVAAGAPLAPAAPAPAPTLSPQKRRAQEARAAAGASEADDTPTDADHAQKDTD